MAIDLSFVETKELLTEVFTRFDAVLFTAYRDLDEKRYDVSTLTKGSPLEVLGLSRFTISHVERTTVDAEGEDA
jgi:hypothetical protein